MTTVPWGQRGLCRKLKASLGIENRNKSQTIKCQWQQGKHHPFLFSWLPTNPSQVTFYPPTLLPAGSAAHWLWDVRQAGDLNSPDSIWCMKDGDERHDLFGKVLACICPASAWYHSRAGHGSRVVLTLCPAVTRVKRHLRTCNQTKENSWSQKVARTVSDSLTSLR